MGINRMNQVKRKVKEGLYSLDIFGSPVTLLHYGAESASSIVGAVGAIAMLAIFFGVFNNNIIGFFKL
jgi:uncharacterized membrane protein